MRFEEGIGDSAHSLPTGFDASTSLGCRRH